MNQLSIFDFIEDKNKKWDVLEEYALRGSGFENGITRIRKFFEECDSPKARVVFLKTNMV